MTDRIRTLALMERLRRHDMAAEARELADLRAKRDALENNRVTLLERLRTEARIVTLESAPYIGRYIRAVRSEEAQINRALAQTTPRVEELEHAMLERFQELATIRLARERMEKVLGQARDMRETTHRDEQTLTRYLGRRRG
jgi:hypothetical protein